MQCELCGKEGRCSPALIDGVKMMVCSNCMQHGKSITMPKRTPAAKPGSFHRPSRPQPYSKDIYEKMDKELVDDWPTLIRDARKKKSLNREQLGFKIGERTVTIAKLENGELRPSDKLIEKLEKELDIKLLEEVQRPSSLGGHSQGKGLTLGDFIRKE